MSTVVNSQSRKPKKPVPKCDPWENDFTLPLVERIATLRKRTPIDKPVNGLDVAERLLWDCLDDVERAVALIAHEVESLPGRSCWELRPSITRAVGAAELCRLHYGGMQLWQVTYSDIRVADDPAPDPFYPWALALRRLWMELHSDAWYVVRDQCSVTRLPGHTHEDRAELKSHLRPLKKLKKAVSAVRAGVMDVMGYEMWTIHYREKPKAKK